MKISILENIHNYLKHFENTNLINREIINLSKEIESFCFKCNKQSLFVCENNEKKEDLNEKDFEDITKKVLSLDDIDFNPCSYANHDILNKYLYLSDYLEKSYDKEEAVIYLKNLISTKNISIADIIYNSTIDEELLNNILNDKVKITKDDGIKLCFGLNLNYHESLNLLLRFGYTLCVLNKRDCIVRYGIEHNLAIDEVDYILEELSEKSLI